MNLSRFRIIERELMPTKISKMHFKSKIKRFKYQYKGISNEISKQSWLLGKDHEIINLQTISITWSMLVSINFLLTHALLVVQFLFRYSRNETRNRLETDFDENFWRILRGVYFLVPAVACFPNVWSTLKDLN